MTRSGNASEEHSALVLRRTDYGESDLIVGLFTDTLGRVTALARGARKSRHRFTGTLETFCTISVSLRDAHGSDLLHLEGARLVHPRLSLLLEVPALTAGGQALSWLRQTLPARAPDTFLWQHINRYLDHLDARPPNCTERADAALAEFGLALLGALGWALSLDRCVACGRACPETAKARLDPRRGGVICHRCGLGSFLVGAGTRHRIGLATTGALDVLTNEEGPSVRSLVESTLAVHAGVGT